MEVCSLWVSSKTESQSVILADAGTQTEEEQAEQQEMVAKVFYSDEDIHNDEADSGSEADDISGWEEQLEWWWSNLMMIRLDDR